MNKATSLYIIPGIYSTATEGSSQIIISLDPQPALIGEDVEIRCTHIQSLVYPRISLYDKEGKFQTLKNIGKYSFHNSLYINRDAVFVVTLHNASVSDNGTKFECYVRSSGRRITSGTRVLRVGHKGEGIYCIYIYIYIYIYMY